MALPFVHELLGFAGTKPNTADGDSPQSVAIARGVLDILEIKEHTIDEAQIVAILEADDFLTLTSGIGAIEACRTFHGEVELQTRGVTAANDLTALQHLLWRHIGAPHLPHELVVFTIGDWHAFACQRCKSNDGALARLTVYFG